MKSLAEQKKNGKKTGLLEKDQKNGRERIINFLAYPGNYGFVPQTLSGDGDPIDLIDLDESLPRGKFKEIKVIGAIYFEDKKVLEILKTWFSSYKKPGKMIFFRYIDKEEALTILDDAHKKWVRKKRKNLISKPLATIE